MAPDGPCAIQNRNYLVTQPEEWPKEPPASLCNVDIFFCLPGGSYVFTPKTPTWSIHRHLWWSLRVTKFPLCLCLPGLCQCSLMRKLHHHAFMCVMSSHAPSMESQVFTVSFWLFLYVFHSRLNFVFVCLCVCRVSSPKSILSFLLNSHMRMTQGIWFHSKIRLTSIESQMSPCGHFVFHFLTQKLLYWQLTTALVLSLLHVYHGLSSAKKKGICQKYNVFFHFSHEFLWFMQIHFDTMCLWIICDIAYISCHMIHVLHFYKHWNPVSRFKLILFSLTIYFKLKSDKIGCFISSSTKCLMILDYFIFCVALVRNVYLWKWAPLTYYHWSFKYIWNFLFSMIKLVQNKLH